MLLLMEEIRLTTWDVKNPVNIGMSYQPQPLPQRRPICFTSRPFSPSSSGSETSRLLKPETNGESFETIVDGRNPAPVEVGT